ncbi:hypothetical protein BESB_033920 [Besnoitia besnoiti]|uniref:SAG-related sequence n=1 Tax=Besnoitia besnoiti TaxID=94643 RepID=A0A2A9MIA6_BESBE|nr:hypothetical protein BESB_033920 [Besnoitia besnoiti]PFH36934.1 hypothetical protein BESB_033920 [Besnoitia besnoiti]
MHPLNIAYLQAKTSPCHGVAHVSAPAAPLMVEQGEPETAGTVGGKKACGSLGGEHARWASNIAMSSRTHGDPLVQNFGAIHECEPQSSGAQTVKTRILGPTEETLRLRCGSDDRAVLTPAKGNRFFPDKDHTLAGESLNNVCDGATLVPSEGSTQPKTYTLNVGRRGRKPRDLYYKCTLATVSPWAVTAGEGHGAGAQQNTTMKTCILEIKVEAEEPQGPEPKPAKGYHAKPKARGGSSMQEASNPDVIKRCDLDDTTTPEIDLTLPLDAPSVSFSCGKKGSAALKPKASEAKFCADAACVEGLALRGCSLRGAG